MTFRDWRATALFLATLTVSGLNPVSTEALPQVDRALPGWMAQYHVPAAAVAFIENGKVRDAKVVGELQPGVPAPPDTIFEVASLTKPLAAVVALKLVQAGKWNLDEPLSNYWIDPDVKDDPRLGKLTTRMVLSHQTGFPNWRYWNRPTTKLEFEFEPGTKFQYSGEGYVYLRRAMEKKFQQSWNDIARPILIEPLGMINTSWFHDETKAEPRYAPRYDEKGELVSDKLIGEKRGAVVAHYTGPAGAAVTTIDDYAKFAAHVANGAGLSPTLFHELIRPQVSLPPNQGKGLSMGLGWVVVNDLPGGEYALVHGGSEPGVRSFVVVLPKSKRAVVILANGDGGFELCRDIIAKLPHVGPQLVDRLKGYL